MPIFGSNILGGASGQAGAAGIDVGTYTGKSLVFNGTNQILSRTWGAAASDLDSFTISMWIKRGNTDSGSTQYWLVGALTGAESNIKIQADKINVHLTGSNYDFVGTRVLRDTSAWYHLVFRYDSDEGSAGDRFRCYINGELETWASSSTIPSGTDNQFLDSGVPMEIGNDASSSSDFDGYMAALNVIDGSSLAPTSFGETSADTGAWIASDTSGLTFGTNGFSLDFNDERTGTDSTVASGGTVTQSGDYTIHTFTSSGTFTVEEAGNVEYLVVAGGGSGGGRYDGGGGGAGGFKTGTGHAVTAGDYTITVGAGGTGSVDAIGNNGGNSTFDTITSTGGGAGARSDGSTGGTNANSGGSGGGGAYKTASTSNTFGAGTGSEGNAGGQMSNTSNASAAGGGGGAGAVGANPSGGSNRDAGDGGSGVASSISGASVTYAGGGGGAAFNYGGNSAGTGGSGGGGNGGLSADGTDGTANTGGGGGGTSRTGSTNAGGDGGSGIVIIRYSALPDTTSTIYDQANSNNWTGTSLVAGSFTSDTPVNNFCTMNPLFGLHGTTLSEGNLKVTNPDNKAVGGSIAVLSGKWYFEVTANTANYNSVGVARQDEVYGANLNASAEAWMFSYVGSLYEKSVLDTTPTSYTTDDVIGVYLDLDEHKLYFSIDDTPIAIAAGTQNPDTGSNPIALDSGYSYVAASTSNGNNAVVTFNFGANDFAYDPPDGWNKISSANLPEIEIGQGANDLATDYFNTVIYTGNDTSGHSITGMGFSPDLLWIQPRSNGDNGVCFDSVRGNDRQLKLNSTDAEDTHDPVRITLEADGFDLDTTDTNYNGDTRTYVAHGWDAGSSTLGTGDFTQGTIASTCRRSVDGGFSVVSYTGSGSAGTVGHGLSSAPEFIIARPTTAANHWYVYHVGNTTTPEDNGLLFTTSATIDNVFWNDTLPTSSVFSIGDSSVGTNQTETYIAYCMHSVEGFSKMGVYEGNNDDPDGTFVHTNFPVGMVIIKNIDATSNWEIFDNKRSPTNEVNDNLRLDNNNGESTSGGELDFLSNGVKLRTNYGNVNDSNTFIYIAFSSGTGFKYANAI